MHVRNISLVPNICSLTDAVVLAALLYSSLRIAPTFWSIFDPVGISILGFLPRFGPFRAIPRPDSDSGRSDLRFQHVRPQQIMKYVFVHEIPNIGKLKF